MFASLFGKPEESEEDQGAAREDPTPEFCRDYEGLVRSPEQRRDLFDVRKVVMRVGPGHPWRHGHTVIIDIHVEDGEGTLQVMSMHASNNIHLTR